jgi:hypothetical protein
MPNENATRRGRKSPPPGETGQEAAYLRFLSDKQVPVTVKLRDGESVSGWIEYFDEGKRPRNESRPAAPTTAAQTAGTEPRRD